MLFIHTPRHILLFYCVPFNDNNSSLISINNYNSFLISINNYNSSLISLNSSFVFKTDAADYFVKTGLVTGDDNPSTGTGSSCFPYGLKQCDHHEGGPYPLCPSICSPGECATPKCPADEGKGCSESKYGTAWAKDKHFAKKAYAVQGVAAIQTDIMTNGPVSASFTVYDDFLTYKSGVYQKSPGATPDGGHAIKIYG